MSVTVSLGVAAQLFRPTDSMYGPEYFSARVRDKWRRERMMELEYRRIVDELDPGVVVDVGCGDGRFIGWFPYGWTKYGTEGSLHAQSVAVREGISFELPRTKEWADLVVMRGVLQHLPDPIGSLAKAYKWLKPGGLLAVLATPNAGSLHYRIHQDLPALDPPRNYMVFSTKTLRQSLLNIGFDEPSFHYPYLGTPYAQPIRDHLRFLCGRKTAFWRNQMECQARKPAVSKMT